MHITLRNLLKKRELCAVPTLFESRTMLPAWRSPPKSDEKYQE